MAMAMVRFTVRARFVLGSFNHSFVFACTGYATVRVGLLSRLADFLIRPGVNKSVVGQGPELRRNAVDSGALFIGFGPQDAVQCPADWQRLLRRVVVLKHEQESAMFSLRQVRRVPLVVADVELESVHANLVC